MVSSAWTSPDGSSGSWRNRRRRSNWQAWKSPPDLLRAHGVSPEERPYLASMGIYLFEREVLVQMLHDPPLAADFGKEVFPRSIRTHHVQAHLFTGYWEDLGTIKAYHRSSLALASNNPPFDFHSPEGFIYTRMRFLPASRVSAAEMEECLISDGCIIHSGARLTRCVVGVRSQIGEGARLSDTVIIGADRFETEAEREGNRHHGIPSLGIGDGSQVEMAIVDKDARVGRGVQILNRAQVQEAHGPNYVIREGIVVIPKGAVVPDGTRI